MFWRLTESPEGQEHSGAGRAGTKDRNPAGRSAIRRCQNVTSESAGQNAALAAGGKRGGTQASGVSAEAQCDTMAGLQPVGSRRQAEKKTSGKGSAHIRKSAPESSNIACSTRYPGRHTETAR
ncbi:unnamed protein product [Rangifer tarandus platyrhynchus]|uniref:Uncharacterized protein n=1 Tax=Rangifer tarandus platyrhynchus TaxID=3082113 RepID=A0ABN8XTQ6_RANTA|nr:unnamed protein product [Rangifer tarandus platyrhynchus]